MSDLSRLAQEIGKHLQEPDSPFPLTEGIAMAVHDARGKYWNEPPEIMPYIENTIIEVGLQGSIPNHLIEPIRRLAYGAAALDGKFGFGETNAQR